MRVWLYCICKNEKAILPYFLRHYSTFVDKMIFYDDQSTDGTRWLIEHFPKSELRNWPGTHGLVDDEFLDFSNEQWKEARGRADWIIWVDADEFLYHPKMIELLEHYLRSGVELPYVEGYGMVSDFPPTGDGQITDLIKTGFRSSEWDKAAIFRGSIYWTVGRHNIQLERFDKTPVRSEKAEIKLLHYRYLGLDYVAQRNTLNYQAQPERCRRAHHGDNTWPDATKAYSTNWFRNFKNQKFEDVI